MTSSDWLGLAMLATAVLITAIISFNRTRLRIERLRIEDAARARQDERDLELRRTGPFGPAYRQDAPAPYVYERTEHVPPKP